MQMSEYCGGSDWAYGIFETDGKEKEKGTLAKHVDACLSYKHLEGRGRQIFVSSRQIGRAHV